ncbi:NTP transferase domain-containing protein [bacterium]|nr:NTP transferase domain-containing protein [bacterium]
MSFEVVIAAGGAGTRMLPVLGNIPKILAPVGGKPFLTLVLDRWEKLGCKRVHLLLGYAASEVWKICEDWSAASQSTKRSMTLSASIDPYPLGVGGALRFARSCLSNPFVLTYGDVYPTVSIETLLNNLSLQDEGCITVCPSRLAGEPANIAIKNGRVVNYGKNEIGMAYVDVSAIALRPHVLNNGPPEPMNEELFLKPLIASGKLSVYEHKSPSLHIGNPEAYSNFSKWFKANDLIDQK